MALNSCLKYTMTFLLGATVLSLLFFYEIKSDVIRVEINWGTRPRYASFSSASHAYRPMMMMAARNTEELTSAINTSVNVAHSRSKPVLTDIQRVKSHSFDPANSEVQLQKANGLHYRHVRQLSKSEDTLSSVQQARVVTRPPPKARITNTNNKKINIPLKYGISIKDDLPVQQARVVTRPPPKARITNANNKKINIPLKYGISIKDDLPVQQAIMTRPPPKARITNANNKKINMPVKNGIAIKYDLPVQQAKMARPAPKARITNTNNKNNNMPIKIGMPIKDVLSKTAPDWVGETIPPVDLTENKCKDKICSEYLSGFELAQYESCKNETVLKEKKIGKIQPNVNCRFLNGTKRHPVALASFPGSGNTWMRGLLQKITGICTGAIYCDTVLRARGFTGENVKGPSVIVVKTHRANGLFTHGHLPRQVFNYVPVYGAAILLVRDPMSALVSEWNRRKTEQQTNVTSNNHLLTVGEDSFQTNPTWGEYVEKESKNWSDLVIGWIIAAKDNPFLVVRYEDLKKDTIKEMKRVVDFLGFSHISEADITNKLGEGYNNFYRNHTDNFGHFTEKQKAVVQHQVVKTINKLREIGRDNVVPIHKYLLSFVFSGSK